MIELVVYGIPGPQGSKAFKGMTKSGHARLVESSKKVKPWREAVKWAAIELRNTSGWQSVTGPVVTDMIFTLPKPKSAPKMRKTYPDRQPDLSKLVRATEDALTEIGAYEDDARIVGTYSAKRYPGEGTDALESPGAVIRIRRAG